MQERFEDIEALRVRNSFSVGQLRGGNRTPPAIEGFSASVAIYIFRFHSCGSHLMPHPFERRCWRACGFVTFHAVGAAGLRFELDFSNVENRRDTPLRPPTFSAFRTAKQDVSRAAAAEEGEFLLRSFGSAV